MEGGGGRGAATALLVSGSADAPAGQSFYAMAGLSLAALARQLRTAAAGDIRLPGYGSVQSANRLLFCRPFASLTPLDGRSANRGHRGWTTFSGPRMDLAPPSRRSGAPGGRHPAPGRLPTGGERARSWRTGELWDAYRPPDEARLTAPGRVAWQS